MKWRTKKKKKQEENCKIDVTWQDPRPSGPSLASAPRGRWHVKSAAPKNETSKNWTSLVLPWHQYHPIKFVPRSNTKLLQVAVPSPHTDVRTKKKISGEKLQAETKDAHTDPERVARIQIPGERLRKTMEEKEKKLDHGKGAHTLSRDAGSSAEAGRILAATWARGARSVRARGARKRRGGSPGAQAKMGSGRGGGRGANWGAGRRGAFPFYYYRVIISFWACACLFMWRYQNLFRFFFFSLWFDDEESLTSTKCMFSWLKNLDFGTVAHFIIT